MNTFRKYLDNLNIPLLSLNILHSLNDAFEANYALLLPFIAKDLNIDLIQVGALGTLLYVFGIILALPSGYIAVRIGGFMTLILALFIYSIGFLGIGFSDSYFHLVCMFILGGIGLGLFHPIAFALIARWSTKETRGGAMGSFSAVGDLGKISISTLLTFIIVYLGWQRSAFIYGFIALFIAAIFYFFFMKRNDTFKAKEHKTIHMSLWEIVKNKQFVLAAITNVFDNFASQTLFIFLPFLLLSKGFDPKILGLFAGAFFIGSFAGRIILGKLVDRYGNTTVFVVSEILMALFIVLLANSTQLYLIVGCAIVLGVFTKGTNPIVKTMVSESVEHHGNFEKAYGINSITSNSAIALAPLLLGFISQKLGILAAFNVMAVVALLATIPAIVFHHKKYLPSIDIR